jgi:hypothetical protein
MNGKYYLYRYIRKDTNQPFYIGIGSKSNKEEKYIYREYKRAYTKTNRSKYFTNIINNVDFVVEIMFETNDINLIKEKEKEFIKLYGRIDLNEGTLVNLTDGGDGNFNMSNENRERLSELAHKRFIGKPLTNEHKNKISESQIGRVQTPESIKKRTETRKNNATKRGYYTPKEKIEKESIPIIQYDLNMNIIKEWSSISEAARNLNVGKSNIINVCKQKKRYKTAYGYIWRYKV